MSDDRSDGRPHPGPVIRPTLVAGVLLAAASLTACGSTVPQAEQALSAPAAAGGLGAAAGSDVAAPPSGGQVVGAGPQAPTAELGSSSRRTGSTPATAGGSAAGSGARAGDPPAAAGTRSAAPGAGPGPRVTQPVRIGFVNTKVGNAEAAGLNIGQTASPEKVFRTLVSSVNAQGGIAGRKIIPVTADTDTASGDWNSDFQAACERLARDQKAEVVLGYVFAQLDSFESCLAKAGVPHLSGAYTIGDEQTLRQFPQLVGTNALTADRRFRLQLEGAVREGYLTRSNKIGIVVDGCPSSLRAVKNSVDPYVRSAGLQEAARVVFSCPSGSGDAGAAASQVQGAVLRFRQNGVDRVFIEGIPLVLFSQAAESQGYRPGYLVTSTSPGSAAEPNMPKEQLKNVRGYGWMPHMDVSKASRPAPTAAQQRCLALLKSGGFVPREFNDFLAAYTSCDGLFAYEAALQRTGGRSGGAEVVQALTALGRSLPAAGTYGGRTDYSRRNAPAVYRAWRYGTDCSCFRYSSGEQPIS